MSASCASKVVRNAYKIVEGLLLLVCFLTISLKWQVCIGNIVSEVESFDREIYKSNLHYSYVDIFSEKYYLRLNLFRQRIKILGALYILICFLARTNSLHFGQYQALS